MASALGAEEAGSAPPSSLPCLDASDLISRDCGQAFHDVRRLANILSIVNLDSRREDLLDYIRLNRARFIKSYVSVRWLSGRHGELVVNASNALAEARAQREQIDTCQDQFFFMHGGLFGARQRLYDVPVAVDVLVNGRYPWLPKGIEYCGGDVDPRPIVDLSADRQEIIPRVERAIRLALLRRMGVPSQFTSHTIRNGVLFLSVEGEFELAITLYTESEDARWTLVGVKVKVQAREGESVTTPLTDLRQRSYFHEVVQKVMDAHSGTGEAKLDPLLAAYQVCHDLCCGVMLEILHAQAQKLATRIGGLWASQLTVLFDKDKQVLDLCIWQREFRTGLAGTGRDVGAGSMHADDDVLHQRPPTESAEIAGTHGLPPAPVGCRYMRVHRLADVDGQVVVSLGPVGEYFQPHPTEGDRGVESDANKTSEKYRAAADVLLGDTVQVHPDRLSCGQMLLAASRMFASQKIVALASNLEDMARSLGARFPWVSMVNPTAACIYPWRNEAVEVSVDVKSGRFVVQDTLSCRSKAMARCISRLGEALNLLPRTDTQSLSATIAAALNTGRPSSSVRHLSSKNVQDGEQQDLRQQQVRRCMAESLRLLRREEVERVWRCSFGMMPGQRWQALLGRADTVLTNVGAPVAVNDGLSTLRSLVCLSQFREEGVRLSDEWRRRRRDDRLRRRGLGVIELTCAERAATGSQGPPEVSVGGTLSHNTLDPLPRSLGLRNALLIADGALPGLAASLVEGSDVEDVDAPRPPLRQRGNKGEKSGSDVDGFSKVQGTDEHLSFFLEAAVTANMSMEHTLIVAALSTVAEAGPSLRPKVCETYQIRPLPPQASSSFDSLEAALPPYDLASAVGRQGSIVVKRSATWASGGDVANGTNVDGSVTLTGNIAGPEGSPVAKRAAIATPAGGCAASPRSAYCCAPAPSTTSSEIIQVREAVQIAKDLIPFARLQHALTRVGTGILLELGSLTQRASPLRKVSQSAVLLEGEKGWSSPQLAATSAHVRSLHGHSQACSWEWHVSLSSTTQVANHGSAGSPRINEQAAVHQHLPLVLSTEIAADTADDCFQDDIHTKADGSGPGGNHEGRSTGGRKFIRFRFPASFSVHAMCRSFALAGEGLTAMLHLFSQAAELMQGGEGTEGYGVLSCSPMHVALRDFGCGHVVLLTHSAFSAAHISSARRPGLILISQPDRSTCPAALSELEASIRKHLDLRALLHGLSLSIPVLEVVASVVPGVGQGDFAAVGDVGSDFLLSAMSPACYVLSDRSAPEATEASPSPRPALMLMSEAGGCVRVSGWGSKDAVADAAAFRELLLEWIASTPASCNAV